MNLEELKKMIDEFMLFTVGQRVWFIDYEITKDGDAYTKRYRGIYDALLDDIQIRISSSSGFAVIFFLRKSDGHISVKRWDNNVSRCVFATRSFAEMIAEAEKGGC